MQLFKSKKSEEKSEFHKISKLPFKEKLGYFVRKFLSESADTKDMSFFFQSSPNHADIYGIKVPSDKTIDFKILKDINESFGVKAISKTEDGSIFIQLEL